jgi:catechol 2,3-dioxygenase-like lactoylglutathione lyase family enzyme
MEGMISKLLQDYEDGRMSRRELIRNLAFTAAAAAGTATVSAQNPAPAQPPIPPSTAKWKTVWVDHISYQVADFRKSAEFYVDLMGWEVKSLAATQCTLEMGTAGGIIIRNGPRPQTPATGTPPAAPAAPARAPITGVINHISFGVEPWDTEAVKAELERRGLTPRPDMVGDNFKSFHVKDPDGWDLQISNKTSGR